jgi:hypothetical protein
MSTNYTHAEIRGAILRAATTVERDPKLFKWSVCHIPECGTPGCAVGWIGAHLGIPANESLEQVARELGVLDVFYERMSEVTQQFGWSYGQWRDSAEYAATALRAYADKYYPAVAEVAESADTATWASVKQATGWVPARMVRS